MLRMGVGFGRYDDPYMTIAPQFEATIVETLADLAENDYLYKGLRSTLWCIHDETALAEAEIEYKDHTSPSVYVRFRANDAQRAALLAKFGLDDDGTPLSFVIWTTTPWTLPANVAIALKPDATYGVYRAGDEDIIVAEALASAVLARSALRQAQGDNDDGDAARRDRRRRARTARRSASVPRPRFPHRARGLRRARNRDRRRAHRARSRRGRFRDRRRGTVCRSSTRSTPAGASPPRPARTPACGSSTRTRGSSTICARRARWSRTSRTTTATRTAGAARTPSCSARPRSGSSAWTATALRERSERAVHGVEWMPEWGETRMSQMVAQPSRVVRLAPARVGDADPGGRVHCVQRIGARSAARAQLRESDARALVRRRQRVRSVVDGARRSVRAAGAGVRALRRHGVREGTQHRRHLVRVGRDVARRARRARDEVPGRRVPRRRRPVPRLVSLEPDHVGRDARRRAVREGDLVRVGGRPARPRDAQVGRQLHRRRRRDAEVRRGPAAAVGRVDRRVRRRRPASARRCSTTSRTSTATCAIGCAFCSG